MKKFLQKKLKEQKGMTLIELLAVIVILAIIAAIAIPAIGGLIENSRYSAVKADATNALNAANIYFTENPTVPSVTVTVLGTEKYLDTKGKLLGSETITKVSGGNTITSAAGAGATYATGKTVIFNGSTISSINLDTNKGSTNAASVTIN